MTSTEHLDAVKSVTKDLSRELRKPIGMFRFKRGDTMWMTGRVGKRHERRARLVPRLLLTIHDRRISARKASRSPGVKEVAAAHPDVEVHIYPADHGFSCDQRGSYDKPSAVLARTRTLAFLRKHLG